MYKYKKLIFFITFSLVLPHLYGQTFFQEKDFVKELVAPKNEDRKEIIFNRNGKTIIFDGFHTYEYYKLPTNWNIELSTKQISSINKTFPKFNAWKAQQYPDGIWDIEEYFSFSTSPYISLSVAKGDFNDDTIEDAVVLGYDDTSEILLVILSTITSTAIEYKSIPVCATNRDKFIKNYNLRPINNCLSYESKNQLPTSPTYFIYKVYKKGTIFHYLGHEDTTLTDAFEIHSIYKRPEDGKLFSPCYGIFSIKTNNKPKRCFDKFYKTQCFYLFGFCL
jgi:hypothetical protein